jgi:hypothetical protein
MRMTSAPTAFPTAKAAADDARSSAALLTMSYLGAIRTMPPVMYGQGQPGSWRALSGDATGPREYA